MPSFRCIRSQNGKLGKKTVIILKNSRSRSVELLSGFFLIVQLFSSIIKDHKPKLIITDPLMSGYNRRTLTKELKGNSETENIKIMTMSVHPDEKKLSEKAGVDDFLTKPSEIDDLVSKVEFLSK
ncbi:response regulator [Kaistella sp. G5-32]|uniref:Response regulator n=1 Tax=Kaistella gelatinilytica TaxID=2787636 RepID=A0ABS0FD98_9FLAO|nr:response regulator [Kaistella gelatinilytica]MBF8457650.1 response regulator [Kaistella gelatinilytica]